MAITTEIATSYSSGTAIADVELAKILAIPRRNAITRAAIPNYAIVASRNVNTNGT